MHIYFAGIGGTGSGPLAIIAKQAGYDVSGSDKQDSSYIQSVRKVGIEGLSLDQSGRYLESLHVKLPIDWVVYSSALVKENPDHPELEMAKKLGIRISKRDEFINFLLKDKGLKLIAIAGTHGKTTTTAMMIWVLKQLGVPVSYSVGAKLSFGEMGEYDSKSQYFVYEADEYDRNFMNFKPEISIISGIAYDHPDVYPTINDYTQAFADFVGQSLQVIAHPDDLEKIGYKSDTELINPRSFNLIGEVNRKNAQLVAEATLEIAKDLQLNTSNENIIGILNEFPGLSRRFEKIANNIYSDYAHTPEKILGALQIAREVAGDNVVVVYEGLHNTRQHFIKDRLVDLFKGVKKLYVVPSYRAREDESLDDLTPEKLCQIICFPDERVPSRLDENLKVEITNNATTENLVLCLSAGGGGSLDEWLRKEFRD